MRVWNTQILIILQASKIQALVITVHLHIGVVAAVVTNPHRWQQLIPPQA